MSDLVNISDYFAGKHIFVTGGTGFIGKVLIEKFLRSCPALGGIHCLVRPKKGSSAQDRMNTLLEEKLYDHIRATDPKVFQKVHAVTGDVLEPELGLSDETRHRLSSLINVVIHGAATIKFDEKIRLALEMNVMGVRKMIKFSKELLNLEVFLHVSTAYANCDRMDIEEIFYPPKVHPNKVAELLSWMDDETLDSLTTTIIGEKPNTYTYTKQLAEWVLLEEGEGLPLAVVRPSIVTAALQEPMPGWIDNWNGPSGLSIALGKGFLRTMQGDRNAVADLIPVDLLVNAMIAVTWSTAICKPEKNMIYHLTTGGINPITWGRVEKELVKVYLKTPLNSSIGIPKCVLTKYSFVHKFRVLVHHILPAVLLDTGVRLAGGKPRMLFMYLKINKSLSVLDYFTKRTWQWTNNNVSSLESSMLADDKMIFNFDPGRIDWAKYIEHFANGVKVNVLKEKPEDLHNARKRLRDLILIEYGMKAVAIIVVWKILLAKSPIIRTLWMYILGLLSSFLTAAKIRLGFPSTKHSNRHFTVPG